jgi:hypothetical protein
MLKTSNEPRAMRVAQTGSDDRGLAMRAERYCGIFVAASVATSGDLTWSRRIAAADTRWYRPTC